VGQRGGLRLWRGGWPSDDLDDFGDGDQDASDGHDQGGELCGVGEVHARSIGRDRDSPDVRSYLLA